MRIEQIGPNAPGQLVAVSGGQAFLPKLLAPSLPSSWELTRAIEESRAAIAELSARLAQMENPEHILHPLGRREAVLSSRIEGTITHVRDVLLAEAAPLARSEENNDTREVLNYIAALDLGRRMIADGHPLHFSLIRGLHETLLEGARGANRHPGEFRPTQVQIGGVPNDLETARFVPPPPEQVRPLMEDLVAFVNREPMYGPLVECAILHYQFETIHPFEDGNGRIGRLLVPLYLQSKGALDRPVLYVSAYLERKRDEYIDSLYRVSTAGEWLPWILFFLTAITEQSRDTALRARRVTELHNLYREKARGMSSRAAFRAVDLIVQRLVVSVSDVAKFTNTSYPTSRTGLDQLAAEGVVTSVGRMGGKEIWIAEQLMREIEVT